MSRKPRDLNKTKISPMSRLGTLTMLGNTARNLSPTLALCVATWPVSPERPDLSPLLQPGVAVHPFPNAIWFACTRRETFRRDGEDIRRDVIMVKNPSADAIKEIYKRGWLPPIVAAAREKALEETGADHTFRNFRVSIQDHLRAIIANPALIPSTLVASFDVFIPPWQPEPEWKKYRLR